MGIKLTGVEATLSTFRELDRRFKAAAAAEIERGAKEIAALARMFAPIDRGDLVKSIRALRVNDAGSYKWRVKVGGTIGGRDVSEYAARAHELMILTRGGKQVPKIPGRLRPGKKSRQKAERLGVLVGGDYLARAYKALRKQIEANVRQALKGEVNDLARKYQRSKGRSKKK